MNGEELVAVIHSMWEQPVQVRHSYLQPLHLDVTCTWNKLVQNVAGYGNAQITVLLIT